MCNLSEGIREEGIQQGIQQGFQIGYQMAERKYKLMIDELKITLIVLMLQHGHSMTEALKKAEISPKDEGVVRETIKLEYPELFQNPSQEAL